MRDKRKYEELFPEEFSAILKQTPICYWACGPMEYHGLQNTLGIDPAKAYEICLRAATISGGVVFPLVPFAPGGGYPPCKSRAELHQLAPEHVHTLCTGVETCVQLYTELFESLADRGFKSCVAFGGHGPAGALLKKIEKDFDGRMHNMRFATYTSTSFIADLVKATGLGYGHGGMWETSMNMAVNPEFVDLSRTNGPANGVWPADCQKFPDKLLEAVMQSNLEFGNKLVDVSAQAVAEAALKLLVATHTDAGK